ncbi:MAG: PolC-type DNA polymerase III [Clostridiales bacterium]|nr:PolC-type DNA polymerase III [Clostridiales bacterium]
MREQLGQIYTACGLDPDALFLREGRFVREENRVTLAFVVQDYFGFRDRQSQFEELVRELLAPVAALFDYTESKPEPEPEPASKYVYAAPTPGTRIQYDIEVDLPASGILFGKPISENAETLPMDAYLEGATGKVCICGRLVTIGEVRESWAAKNPQLAQKNNKAGGGDYQLRFTLTDRTDSLYCDVSFAKEWEAKRMAHWLALADKSGFDFLVHGIIRVSKKLGDPILYADTIQLRKRAMREDAETEKRVELHLHTRMSAKDALTEVGALFSTAKRFGHSAVAITDHGVVQSFPEAYKHSRKTGVKALYGVEGYLLPDTELVDARGLPVVVFDLETTGLVAEKCEIIEIGAVKLCDGEIVDRFQSFVANGGLLPPEITRLTGITQRMLTGAPILRDALAAFYAFCGEGALLCAHNAKFDCGFLRVHGERVGLPLQYPCADTLLLSRALLRDAVENHKLPTLCAHFGIDMGNHHRADDDAQSCAALLQQLETLLRTRGMDRLPAYPAEGGTDAEFAFGAEAEGKKKKERTKTYHISILAATQRGMKNLYKLISFSHLDYFRGRPLIPRSLLYMYREGLLIGSACEAGELFSAVLAGEPDAKLCDIAAFYDYLEIMPRGNNAFLLREGTVADEDALLALNHRIAALGERLGLPVAATGDVHYLEPEDAVYRKLLQFKQGYPDAEEQAPLYYMTTREMLEEFAYLGEDKAREVVITHPNAIAARVADLKPFPDGTHAPKIDDAEEILTQMAQARAHAIYGDELPPIVAARLERELSSIIGNGFASLYLMAQRLVQKSLADGYLVGSRGSVGSSFVATMAGITEVNPLPPHYSCPQCRHSDFEIDREKHSVGADMPDANCPVCGAAYNKEGFEIPFEVFLGFHGEKTPDIDLNFSGDYQPVAHRFVEEMFGRRHAYRAGTISGIAERTAFQYVKHYEETKNLQYRAAEIDRLSKGCSEVKVTTGQHPGGIVIVPKDAEIYDFTPVQHPADKSGERNTVTTHFDFHALDDRLVKLDILGHDDPTALRMLQDLTRIAPDSVPLDDARTRELFSSAAPLGVDLSEINCKVGTLALPEFGTGFVRGVLEQTRPSTFEEFVRISGLTHGTDVWLGNAEPLVRGGTAKLKDVICTRDDIMNYLIRRGMEPSLSFQIMERVRKGRGLSETMQDAMQAANIHGWYIDSCKKIKYMFPRGHAVAYTVMAFRIAWFKLYYPKEFYATYFTVRAGGFELPRALGDAQSVLTELRRLTARTDELSKTEKDLVDILEIVYEMNLRGVTLLRPDIYISDATRYLVEADGIRAPFSAVPGIGNTVAEGIAQRRAGRRFVSISEFQELTKTSVAHIEALRQSKAFGDLPEDRQISLFEL